MVKIKFGTDGWRGIIARNFTFENVRTVAQAVADHLKEQGELKGTTVVVGYDTRFLSDKFALATARVLAGNGIKVILSSCPLPSPALSYSVVSEKADLGIMITASHNPPEYNGFKIKTKFGSPADKSVTDEIENYLFKNKPEDGSGIELKNLIPSYIKKLKTFVDIELLKKIELKVVFDPMFGAGAGLLSEVLKETKCRVFPIHSDSDPYFGGLHPEPIKKYLGDLVKEVKLRRADIGVATDGDADRVGVVDDAGRYLTPHQVFPLLLLYLIEVKGLKGKVVQTISLGYLGERIASFYGLPFQEVPVGFKYVADLMLAEDILIGGEESGGFSHRGYIPERDGVLNSLILLEMIAKRGKKLSWILDDLQRRFGKSYYDRVDIKIIQDSRFKIQDLKDKITQGITKKLPKRIAGMKIREVRTYDGVKFILGSSRLRRVGGESWLLLRPSGTEPLARVYAEANTLQKVRCLLRAGTRMIKAGVTI